MALFSYISLQMRFIWSLQNRQFLEMQHGKKVLRDLQNIINTYLSLVSYLTSGFTNHSQIWAKERSANEKCLQYLKRKQAFCCVRRILWFCLSCLGFFSCLVLIFWGSKTRCGIEGGRKAKRQVVNDYIFLSFLSSTAEHSLRNWNSLYF